MKTLAAFLAAGGMMFSAQATFAQPDAASKMDGEAYEINLNAPENAPAWTNEGQQTPVVTVETVKTGATQNDESNDRQEDAQRNNSAEPRN
jgi:hypothetical protein